MNYWTLAKTSLALASIGILLEPALRRLGYLPPANTKQMLTLDRKAHATPKTRTRSKTSSAVTDASARKQSNGREQRHH